MTVHWRASRRCFIDFSPLDFPSTMFHCASMRWPTIPRPMLAAIHDLDASRAPPVQIVDSTNMDHFRATSLPRVEAPFKLLFVGRLHPSKDPLTLIRALGRLQAESHGAQVSLTLVGWQHDAGYFAELRHAIAALPSPAAVDICEPVSFEQMPALFARHQIVIVPSTVDPLPRVAAEAMAAGLVCIVSDKTGISTLLAGSPGGADFSRWRRPIPCGCDLRGHARSRPGAKIAGRRAAQGRRFLLDGPNDRRDGDLSRRGSRALGSRRRGHQEGRVRN